MLAVVAGCGGGLRTVPTGPHPPRAADPIVVEYPPPPAKAERVSADPGEPCRWMDGHWAWAGRRWHWVPGGWVVPPTDCHYAGSILAWYAPPRLSPASAPPTRTTPGAANPPSPRTEGRLYYTEAKWYPLGSGSACREPSPCAAKSAYQARD